MAPTELYALLSPRDVAKLYILPSSFLSSAFLLARSARVLLLNSYFILHTLGFILLPLSAIFRAFVQPPTKLNAVAAPAKETSANAQARVALSDPRHGGELSIGWMELN